VRERSRSGSNYFKCRNYSGNGPYSGLGYLLRIVLCVTVTIICTVGLCSYSRSPNVWTVWFSFHLDIDGALRTWDLKYHRFARSSNNYTETNRLRRLWFWWWWWWFDNHRQNYHIKSGDTKSGIRGDNANDEEIEVCNRWCRGKKLFVCLLAWHNGEKSAVAAMENAPSQYNFAYSMYHVMSGETADTDMSDLSGHYTHHGK